MKCPRCGQGKWNFVFEDQKVIEDDGKGTQKCTGVLVALKCDCCGLRVTKKEDIEEATL